MLGGFFRRTSESQRLLEMSVSGCRQGRRDGGFPADGQEGLQSCVALFAQGDRPAWRAGEDHDRQERLQHGNAEHEADIEIRRIKYLNNIIEQDHRAVKRVTRPMLGFKSFRSAAATLSGIELMHMIRKGQLRTTGKLRPAQQFYALAA
jgi:hypothetical protein